jgi:hypothetical protein
MLVAIKLDRVTRNVGDLDYLLKTYGGSQAGIRTL